MWSNGESDICSLCEDILITLSLVGSLIACLVILSAFSAYILLAPSIPVRLFLDLMALDMTFKLQLLGIVILNVALCFASEKWLEHALVKGYSRMRNWLRARRSSRRRVAAGKLYKSIT